MKTTLKYLWLMTLIVALLGLAACSDDDDDNNNGGNNPPVPDAWIGKWISAGDDVAPILVAFAGYDSIYATFNENNTVILETHVPDEEWVVTNGTYDVVESESGDIHAISVTYPTYAQEGIIQVFPDDVDYLWLEVVQTNIGATIPTVDAGFGADETLGTMNIQVYRRVE
jgi:hypothetical protein